MPVLSPRHQKSWQVLPLHLREPWAASREVQLPTLLTKVHGEARGERGNQDSMEKEMPSPPRFKLLQPSRRPWYPTFWKLASSFISLLSHSRAWFFSLEALVPSQSQALTQRQLSSTSPTRSSCHRWVSHLACLSLVEGREDCSPRQDHIEPKSHPADPQSTHRTTSRRGINQPEKDLLADIGTTGKTMSRCTVGSRFLFSVDELTIINYLDRYE